MKTKLAHKQKKLAKIRQSIQRDTQTNLFYGLQMALELGVDTRLEICQQLEKEIAALEEAIEAEEKAKEHAKYLQQISDIVPIWD